MKRDEATYGRIRNKFDEWTEIQANKPPAQRVVGPRRTRPPAPASASSEMGKTVFTAIGVGIGALLLLLAVLSLVTAWRWDGFERDGAFVGYFVTGLFLLVAALGGIGATLNHNFRVLPEAHRRHGHPPH